MTLLDALDKLCAAGPLAYRRECVGSLVLWRMADRFGVENLNEREARAALKAVEAGRAKGGG